MATNDTGMPNIDFDKEMVGTIAVPDADKLDLEALTTWFEGNVEGYEGPISYTKFKGGQSNPTYKIDTPGNEPMSCAASRSASCCPAPMLSIVNMRR